MKTIAENNRGFRVHATAFVSTMALLFAINLLTGGPLWILWVLLGWGVGLLTHWWFAVGPGAAAGRTA